MNRKAKARLFFSVSVLLPALAITETFLQATNTLSNTGKWFGTKATIERSVGHGYYFMTNRVSLRKYRMDMGAWHGLNEIIYKDPLAIGAIRLSAQIKKDSYLVVEFNRDGNGFSGIRFSNSPLFSSMYFTANNSGEFTSKTPFALPALPIGWSQIEVDLQEHAISARVNGKPILKIKTPILPKQYFGLRNGQNSVLVNDIEVFAPNGKRIFRETFRNTRWYFLILAIALALILLLDQALIRFNRSPAQSQVFGATTLNMTVFACTLFYFTVDYAYFSKLFHLPNQGPNEQWSRVFYLDKAMKTLPWDPNASLPNDEARAHKNAYHIAFLGGSQTYGEGATKNSDIWVARLERLLNERRPLPRTFRCHNYGFPGGTSDFFKKNYFKTWIDNSPTMTVIDASNNDLQSQRFKENLDKIVSFNKKRNVKTLLVLEPNNIEAKEVPLLLNHYMVLLSNHAAMYTVAQSRDIPYFNMQDYMKDPTVYDSGFLWWDYVHLTSYGQKIFAERLYPEIVRALQ